MDVTANQQLQSFSFPLLKNAEILRCMSDLGIDVTDAELLEPNRHRDTVREVFIKLIEIGLGLSEEELFTPPKRMVRHRDTNLPHPDLHEDSLAELCFLKACIKLMTVCGVPDFGSKDLQAPNSKRFRRQLSGAINLFKFREDKLQIYAELLEHRTKIVTSLDQVKQENVLLNEQLEKTKIDCANEWNMIEEVSNDCAEIEREITSQNKLQASIRHENAELKKKANGLSDEIATTSLALQEAQTEEQRLSAQVVQSPEHVRNELAEASRSLDAKREEADRVEHALQVSKTKFANVLKAKEDLVGVVQLIDDVREVISEKEGVEGEVQKARNDLEANVKRSAEVRKEVEEIERQIRQIEEEATHVQKQHKVKMDSLQQAIDAANRELIFVEKDRRDGMARVEAGEAEVHAIEQAIRDEKKRTEVEVANMIDRFKQVEKIMLEEDSRLMAAIRSS